MLPNFVHKVKGKVVGFFGNPLLSLSFSIQNWIFNIHLIMAHGNQGFFNETDDNLGESGRVPNDLNQVRESPISSTDPNTNKSTHSCDQASLGCWPFCHSPTNPSQAIA